ncbi:tectonin beta-propeller repeat-containing protein 2 [Syngnathoides biaculeatus]|uniref:tectonin beta-propeller repeat-containing protein 2 n=1 Tax=Syngnathoides biaculeatus TaxID=300417 RepID=UPI002ADDADFB|nr:tectonin beta-propeller repeat-containing protein 2 [Syngnathoides biaculeatus]
MNNIWTDNPTTCSPRHCPKGNMASQPSALREFCPLQDLLNAIPAKVQRGFRSVVVYLTAVDSSRDFVAVGSSIGMLYLYCRGLAHMNKYSLEGKCEAITAVKLLSCFDDLVAAGTASGRVAVFQLVSPLPGRNKQLRRFDVVGLHKGTVTSLAWSTNGMKLFSGDDKGRVVFSALDLDQGTCTPTLLLEEPGGVVQLDYSQQVLLVSTQQRSLLYLTHTQQVQQLGTKPRKCNGRFGACFLPALCKQSDLQVFAARPGLRLWRSDVSGHVIDTRLLKAVFDTQIPHFEIFPRSGPAGAYRPAERQLGLLSCFLKEGWILSWNEYSIYVLDCVSQVLVGALESGGDIVSLSCCDNEIFVLKGDRDLIRLSDSPEAACGVSPSASRFPARLSSPLMPQAAVMAPTGCVETAQPIRTLAVVAEGGGRCAEEGEEEEEEAEEAQEKEKEKEKDEGIGILTSCSRSRSSSVTSWDSLRGNASSDADCRRYSAPLGQEEVWQELVVKAVKVKKKKRQRQDSGSGNRLSESSCSEATFPVRDRSCSDGGGAASVADLDPPKQDTRMEVGDGNEEEAEDQEREHSSGRTPQGAEKEAVPLAPDVDVLLECTFSYVRNERDDPLLGPPTQAEGGEDDDSAPPAGVMDQTSDSGLTKPSVSSDDEEGDIYRHALPRVGGGNVEQRSNTHRQEADGEASQRDGRDGRGREAEQLAESWMGYSGPGCGILSLHVTDRHVWCLDFRGGLFCSPLPESSLQWQRFEDNIHQAALSPSGNLLWKVEQKSLTAFACAKVAAAPGKRHWYKAAEQTAFVALSDDSAWIIRTNGDLYLQTGLSAERPCARSVKVDTPCVFSQVCVRGGVAWALSEHNALFYREGLHSFSCLGDTWKYDTVSEAQGVELMCVTLGDGGTAWALDISGRLFFRTGVSSERPQGDDDHWWQVSISDYVVFDQGSLFQTLLNATQSVATVTRAPMERVVAFLSQYSQRQPCLLSANAGGVWVASGHNQLHLARGSLVGTFWQNLVPRGTVAATRWSSVTSSSVPHKEGAFLWLAQSKKDLFCVWDHDGELRPSTVPLPPDVELSQVSACRDALWGLDSHGRVSIRTLSPSCPCGLHWTPLDLSQLGSVRLVSVSCGIQNVWAVDNRGLVYFRVGTQPLNPNMMLPAWIHIEPPEQPVGVQLVSIETSPNDRLLWALDNRGAVFVRTGLSDEMPVGTNWDLVPGLSVSQLVLSCRTVWVRCVNGDLARRYGVSDRNPAGDYWKKIPGNANWLTVTPDDELWAVTALGGLARRMTKLLPPTPRHPAPFGKTAGDDVDDGWELL